jgi:hypothetical protein
MMQTKRKRRLPLLAALLFFALSGCGTMSAGEKGAWIKVGQLAVCAAAKLACERYGGEDCSAWTALGCDVAGGVVDVLAAKKAPPAEAATRAMVITNFASSPLRTTYEAKRVKRQPGFRVPTADKPPLEIK